MLISGKTRRHPRSAWVWDHTLGQYVPPVPVDNSEVAPETAKPIGAISTAAEALPGLVKVDDPKIIAQAEEDVARTFYSLETIKKDAEATAKYLKTLQGIVDKRRAGLKALKSQVATLKTQGMGELIDLEFRFGPISDHEALSGVFGNIRKAVTKPFSDAGSFIDKNVTQRIAHPIGTVFKQLDKAIIQPVAHPIGGVLRQLDKAVIQPVAHPIGSVLRQFDKLAIRPVAKEANRALKKFDKVAISGGIKLLDKYVPGWTVLIIVFAPPIGIAATLAKGTHTFIKTKGSLLAKLKATSLEAFSGVTLVVSLAATVLTFGAAGPAMVAAFTALQLGVRAIKVGIDLAGALEVSRKIKRAAKQAKIAAQAEIKKIDDEEKAYKAEIAKIKEQIDAVRREKARIAALKKQQAVGQTASTSSPVAQVAQKVGVSETTVLVGGFAVLAGVVIVGSMLKGDD